MKKTEKKLPIHWEKSTIGEIFEVMGGGTPDTKNEHYWDGSIPWATSADLDPNHQITFRKSITNKGLANSASNLVPKDSVIVATRVGLGKVGLAKTELCFSQDCQALVFPKDQCSPYFTVLQMSLIVQNFKAISRGTTISGITKKQLLETSFLLPPLPEQHRIVEAIESYLTRLDDAIASLERALVNLKRYRASVLKAAVEGRLVPTEAELARQEGREYEPASVLLERILAERKQRFIEEEAEKERAKEEAKARDKGKPWTKKDDAKALQKGREKAEAKYQEPQAPDTSELPDLPEGWCWASLGQISLFVTSGSRGWAQFYSKQGAIFLRIGNLTRESISLDLGEIQRVSLATNVEGTRSLVKKNDLLISITADIGSVAVVKDLDEEAYINQHIALLRPSVLLSPFFIGWFLKSELGNELLLRNCRGATKQGLGLNDIRETPIALPPLVEQSSISEAIENIASQQENSKHVISANIARCQRLRQSILKWAFEGRLVDQDPNDEPASVLLERIRAEREGQASTSAAKEASPAKKRGRKKKTEA
ncbi:MAG: restriction endonuclease subunit S [Myxococcales bacterium]|nr:restriction endonuclease subunit S [Myxococcales bacterium]